jgi:putative aldouronate transport system permease protein
MFFSGGMIPNFLLVKWLGIYNSIWAIVIPGAISTYNMIIVRTYIQGIPEEIIESVRIDGGNDFQIYTKIILPLSKSTIATIGLFYFVGHWNSYFNPMIYLKDRALMPLQVILKEMIIDMNMQNLGMNYSDIKSEMPTSEMVTASSIVISLIPVLCIYPFVQKYFVKGVMIGSVKG